MNDATDKAVLSALQQNHGTIVLNNPSKALLAVGKENTELHEEVFRVHNELDIYRTALTAIKDIDPGTVTDGLEWAQKIATAALGQIRVGGSNVGKD